MADSTLGRVGEGNRTAGEAVGERARDQFASTGEAIRHSATDAMEQARTMVRDATEQQKHRAADGIQRFARSMHDMARNLEQEQHQGLAAHYTHVAADQLDRMARSLEQRTMDDMLTGVEDFARRQPAAFVGGAFAAGFVLARFLKSSGEGAAPAAADTAAYGRAAGGYAEYEPVRGGYGDAAAGAMATPSGVAMPVQPGGGQRGET